MTREQAIIIARENSRGGYVQHVNMTAHGFTVSDWCDGDSTTDSFENGRWIGGKDDTCWCGCGSTQHHQEPTETADDIADAIREGRHNR